MTVQEARDYLEAQLSERAERFSPLGVSVRIESDYMDKFFYRIESERGARYLTVSIVITAGSGNTDEYAISLGAEIKRGRVNEDELSRSLSRVDEAVAETAERLGKADYLAEEIALLCKESEAEYNLFLKEIKKSEGAARIKSLAISLGLILLMVAMALIAKYALS